MCALPELVQAMAKHMLPRLLPKAKLDVQVIGLSFIFLHLHFCLTHALTPWHMDAHYGMMCMGLVGCMALCACA